MPKRIVIPIILLILFYALSAAQMYAEEDAIEEAKTKAEEIHKIASSDVIYNDEELKAIYYQNIQIIEILKEIRSLLQENLEKTGQSSAPTRP